MGGVVELGLGLGLKLGLHYIPLTNNVDLALEIVPIDLRFYQVSSSIVELYCFWLLVGYVVLFGTITVIDINNGKDRIL